MTSTIYLTENFLKGQTGDGIILADSGVIGTSQVGENVSNPMLTLSNYNTLSPNILLNPTFDDGTLTDWGQSGTPVVESGDFPGLLYQISINNLSSIYQQVSGFENKHPIFEFWHKGQEIILSLEMRDGGDVYVDGFNRIIPNNDDWTRYSIGMYNYYPTTAVSTKITLASVWDGSIVANCSLIASKYYSSVNIGDEYDADITDIIRLSGRKLMIGPGLPAINDSILDIRGNSTMVGNLTVTGTIISGPIYGSIGSQRWVTSIIFSSGSQTQVNWSSGLIELISGTIYGINSGNTGTMSGIVYLYLDINISETDLQISSSYLDVIGDDKIFVATCSSGTSGYASFVSQSNSLPLINASDMITPLSIVNGNLALSSVEAQNISVTNLAAINASMGALSIDDILTMSTGSIRLGSVTSPILGTGVYQDLTGIFALSSDIQTATLTSTGVYAIGGSIAGWIISSTTISSGSLTLNSVIPKITMGSATDYLTGSGVFLGLNSAVYKFHVGNPSGNYLAWNGTNLLVSGNFITGSGMNTSLQTWKTNITFSSVSAVRVDWTSGTITLNDGTSYSIVSGNTGTMSALTYIYLDTGVSSTVLQTTTTYSTAVGSGKILIASALNNTTAASVIPMGGQQPIIDGTAQIAALSILAGSIAAGAITATKISVTNLAAVSATMGNLTIDSTLTMSGAGGAITIGSTPPSSATVGTGLWIDRTGVYSLSSSTQNATLTSSGLSAGAGNILLDSMGARTIISTAASDIRAYTFTNSAGSIVYGGTYGFAAAGDSTIRLTSNNTVGNNSISHIYSIAPSGLRASILLSADDGTLNPAMEISSISGVSSLTTSNLSFLNFQVGAYGITLNTTGDIRLQASAGNSIIINNSGAISNTVIRANGSDLAFFDATNGRVGIGNSAPTVKLDVTGAGLFSSTLLASNLSGTNTGNVTLAGTGTYLTIISQQISQALISLSNMADVTTGSLFYRKTAGTGSPELQTLATLKTDLLLSGANHGDQTTRLLSENLTLANTECYIFAGYINPATFVITLNGDSILEVI